MTRGVNLYTVVGDHRHTGLSSCRRTTAARFWKAIAAMWLPIGDAENPAKIYHKRHKKTDVSAYISLMSASSMGRLSSLFMNRRLKCQQIPIPLSLGMRGRSSVVGRRSSLAAAQWRLIIDRLTSPDTVRRRSAGPRRSREAGGKEGARRHQTVKEVLKMFFMCRRGETHSNREMSFILIRE